MSDPRDPQDGAVADELEADDLEDQTEIDEDPDAEDVSDDEGGDDAAGDADGEGDEGQRQERSSGGVARSHSRRAGRAERAETENRRLREESTQFRRQLDELLAQRAQPTPAELAEAARREDEAYEMMSPAEQRRYTENKLRRELGEELQRDRAVMFERNDKQEFDAHVERNPEYRRLLPAVEELRKQAPNVPRRILLWTAIGRAADEGKDRARSRSGRSGEAQRARQSARPSQARGDVAPQRGRSGTRGFEHLRDVQI